MQLPIRISGESREPVYHQIEIQLKALIIGGQLSPGSVLPSIRSLASDLTCSVITTRRAYQNLEAQGFIKTIQGKGTFVKEIDRKRQEETKQKVVFEAFQDAVEKGTKVGCSPTEMRMIFEKILQEHNQTNGKKGVKE